MYSHRQMRKPRLPTLNRWARKRDCARCPRRKADARRGGSRVGMSSAGMRAVGLAGACFTARRRDSSSEVAPGGAVDPDSRIRQALRRSAGGRIAFAGTGCPDWDFVAPVRGIACGCRFRQRAVG